MKWPILFQRKDQKKAGNKKAANSAVLSFFSSHTVQETRQTTHTNNVTLMEQLARLSVINKLCLELTNHLGICDKTLAEFIYSLAHTPPAASPAGAEQLVDAETFSVALANNGADFSQDLVQILYNILSRMEPTEAPQQVNFSFLNLLFKLFVVLSLDSIFSDFSLPFLVLSLR